MKKKLLIISAVIAASPMLYSFCGFYVSKADGTLKNKTSQVILVRDGNKTVITMYNDFKGDVKDFAMVVPVPVVLQKSDIKVTDNGIFQRLNDYSAPRLVEYYDQNPCEQQVMADMAYSVAPRNRAIKEESGYLKKSLGVTVEAKYTVGEYDILILSAKESSELKTWLTDNGYKVPKGAEEVLEPYIKSNLKFFVVKVNVSEKEKAGLENLRPIQIKFNSPKFMLPIRLGMANADGDQDMIIYGFTRQGRIETTNYRTVAVPTGKNIPLFVKKNFSTFYTNLFRHQWDTENERIAFLEYAWDVSLANYVKCDPCISIPPDYNDLKTAGVWWLGNNDDDYINGNEPDGKVYFTRLHVRYNRNAFPQDLSFQVTPNKENFQARYIITHPAMGIFNCEEGKKYMADLKERRRKELNMLASLTGKDASDWDITLNDEENMNITADVSYSNLSQLSTNEPGKKSGSTEIILASAVILGCISAVKYKGNKK
ncbi:MAG TPA: DUF2330 domain-containing protein [Chitinophagaceae bacterium]|nr:DUF2330 domain-containing protein [Chitinophagaceae bacterium]